MKKLLVLAMCLGMLLAMPLSVGATQITNDPSPDNPYDKDDSEESTDTTEEEDPDKNGDNGDGDQYNKGDDPDDITTDETTTVDPNKSPKTGDTSKAGAAAGVVVIAGGVAYFAGRRLKRA